MTITTIGNKIISDTKKRKISGKRNGNLEARENLRGSGILLSISSLPSPYGIGTLGREAYNFVDLLGDLKQKYWQVLPVGPTIFGDSPYQPSSGCAGNIYFIDLDKLVDEGLLEKEEILGYNWGTDESEIDYAALHQNRCKILQKAFERFDTNAQEFQDFVKKQSEWLEQYALFMTLKTDNLYKNWSEWPSEYRNPQTVALEKYQKRIIIQLLFGSSVNINSSSNGRI